MPASKESRTAVLEKRLMRIENTVGLNEDGTKNGNGLIHKMEEVKEEIKNLRNDIKSYDTYLDNLSEDFIKIDLRIEKLENQIQDFLQKMKEDKDKKENELKEIKKSLEGNITVDTLHKFQKAVVGIAGLLTAIGTIIGAVLYFTK
ncbi:hypothetical protein OFP88_05175 [Brachyspira hyodysenteriae]|uniref:hypothetical protein n=2 Tax=Brachyspira hyodysenteriae TaxID=159 RepID=UPI0022CD5710|nr:hypothetical protein [Brachyspira hyodysenteriae]MCZ9871924.1 hypothetical protein [Brachyspira hyodysenteriae]MCZ9875426.1 hypothetical protein [Brachyspira hyodysenteriae]MCZ9929895.1 hypothetical protein [Brachyspira hyodysenteriae]MCZ9931560.1 hypothetical protein [Brachyspira hyodysenteriae]MCZ9931963.1 hypothetical protein [Brachyspira hyodysenteriae]